VRVLFSHPLTTPGLTIFPTDCARYSESGELDVPKHTRPASHRSDPPRRSAGQATTAAPPRSAGDAHRGAGWRDRVVARVASMLPSVMASRYVSWPPTRGAKLKLPACREPLPRPPFRDDCRPRRAMERSAAWSASWTCCVSNARHAAGRVATMWRTCSRRSDRATSRAAIWASAQPEPTRQGRQVNGLRQGAQGRPLD
jgi:hypothetical protein